LVRFAQAELRRKVFKMEFLKLTMQGLAELLTPQVDSSGDRRDRTQAQLLLFVGHPTANGRGRGRAEGDDEWQTTTRRQA
jgi:hypothetical protein